MKYGKLNGSSLFCFSVAINETGGKKKKYGCRPPASGTATEDARVCVRTLDGVQ
jgi:hypothetical protein